MCHFKNQIYENSINDREWCVQYIKIGKSISNGLIKKKDIQNLTIFMVLIHSAELTTMSQQCMSWHVTLFSEVMFVCKQSHMGFVPAQAL